MKASIVILSWNRRDEIAHCLDRLRECFDGEVVVVDQGSKDGSRELLESRTDIHLVALEENVGVAAGRNIGNAAAGGDIIISIDSDATFATDFSFELVRKEFEAAERLGAISFRVRNVSLGSDQWPYSNEPSLIPFETTRFAGGGHALRKTAFDEVKGYDPSLFFYWEEFELSAKLIGKGYEIHYKPDLVVEHAPSANARVEWRTGRYFYRVRNRIYIIRKFFRGWAKLRELVFISAAYALLSLRLGLIGQATRGVIAGLSMPVSSQPTTTELRRFTRKWQELERANRPSPLTWMQRTSKLIRG